MKAAASMSIKNKPQDEAVSREVAARLRSNGSNPIRVLMADPDDSLQSAYRTPLAEQGFEIVAAHCGLECMARLREFTPDLLVLEPQLPWGGGDGVLALMSDDAQLASIPVMILTSCSDPHVLNQVTRFPVGGYHRKPLASSQLAGVLHKLINRAKRPIGLSERAGRLEDFIARRTNGQIQNVRVETVGTGVVVRGRSKSPVANQLVLAAVMEAIGGAAAYSGTIECQIDVE